MNEWMNVRNISKVQSDDCTTSLIRFVIGGRTDLTKPIFVSINFAMASKRCIHKTSYTTTYKTNPWDPSGTSHVENFLIFLNKYTLKGALRYNIIRYGRCGVRDVAVNMYKCRTVRIKLCNNGNRKVIIFVKKSV